jgi:hypothetical protein
MRRDIFVGLTMQRDIFKAVVIRRKTEPDTHLFEHGDVKLRAYWCWECTSAPWCGTAAVTMATQHTVESLNMQLTHATRALRTLYAFYWSLWAVKFFVTKRCASQPACAVQCLALTGTERGALHFFPRSAYMRIHSPCTIRLSFHTTYHWISLFKSYIQSAN